MQPRRYGRGCNRNTRTLREFSELLSRSGKLNAPRGKSEKAQPKRERTFLKIAFILRKRTEERKEKEKENPENRGSVILPEAGTIQVVESPFGVPPARCCSRRGAVSTELHSEMELPHDEERNHGETFDPELGLQEASWLFAVDNEAVGRDTTDVREAHAGSCQQDQQRV